MFVDLTHNRIVELSITEGFRRAMETSLLPKLKEKYGNALLSVQMYEDHLSDGFLREGKFYYPLTVLLESYLSTEWIVWDVNDTDFSGGNPFSYLGTSPLEISPSPNTPVEFQLKLEGKTRYFDGNSLKIEIIAPDENPAFLSGKYSQTFVDALSVAITKEIEKEFHVVGLSASGITLQMPFAPGTYMEHTSEGTTYRRLLMTDGSRTLRDFWVKWTQDETNPELYRFALGEDVPTKVREREYRFLVREDPERYRAAMGKRNATEWRDIPKRAIKKGVLLQLDDKTPLPLKNAYATPENTFDETPIVKEDKPITDEELVARLEELLDTKPEESTPVPTVEPEEDSDFARAMAFAKEAVAAETSSVTGGVEDDTRTSEEEPAAELDEESAPIVTPSDEENNATSAENFPENEKSENDADSDPEEIFQDQLTIEELLREEIAPETETTAPENDAIPVTQISLASEETQNEDNEELDTISQENAEKSTPVPQKSPEEALEDKIRANLEREFLERETARFEEVERMALERQAQIERERLALEEERKANREEAIRLSELSKKLQEEDPKIEEKTQVDFSANHEETCENGENSAPVPENAPDFMHRTVHLFFRHVVDGGVSSRIRTLLSETLTAEKKENIFISVKSTIVGENEVLLDFLKIPTTEYDLLIAMIRKLGNSDLGIHKVILDEDNS